MRGHLESGRETIESLSRGRPLLRTAAAFVLGSAAAGPASTQAYAQVQSARAEVRPAHAPVQPRLEPSALNPARPPVTPITHYRVNAGDDLDVFVWGEERMQRTVRVLPDGTFAFPLAGMITAVGRSVDDISSEIRDRISINYRSDPPDVTVAVRDTTGARFYVVGKVRTPGSYTAGRAVDIVQALSMAGGLAEFADVKNAVILRETAQGQIVEPVRLANVLKGGKKLSAGKLVNPLPMLRSGDTLVIP